MLDRKFLASRVGQAAMGSLFAMVAFVVMSTQIAVTAPVPQIAVAQTAELA